MHVYRGTSAQFIGDAVQNRVDTLFAARLFEEFRYKPGSSGINSRRMSLSAMEGVLNLADLRDQAIQVELRGPGQ